jgi:hypothetical protein
MGVQILCLQNNPEGNPNIMEGKLDGHVRESFLGKLIIVLHFD